MKIFVLDNFAKLSHRKALGVLDQNLAFIRFLSNELVTLIANVNSNNSLENVERNGSIQVIELC